VRKKEREGAREIEREGGREGASERARKRRREGGMRVFMSTRSFYRVAKTHRIPHLCRSFSAKVTYIEWLFCGK